MKLKPFVIDKIRKSKTCKNMLALKMNVHSGTVDRWLKDNETNGPLTTAMAMNIISEDTGIEKNRLLTEK